MRPRPRWLGAVAPWSLLLVPIIAGAAGWFIGPLVSKWWAVVILLVVAVILGGLLAPTVIWFVFWARNANQGSLWFYFRQIPIGFRAMRRRDW